MANYRAMTAFRKALSDPEDHFDVGTSFRSDDGVVITKLDEDLWVYLQSLAANPGPELVEMDTLRMHDVIATVRNSSTDWEVSHNWKAAKSVDRNGDEDEGPGKPEKAKPDDE